MAAHEINWSAFLREPTSVERWLERGDVLLKRREGPTLRLSKDASGTSQREALQAAVRLLTGSAGAARKASPMSSEEVGSRLPWTKFLPASDRTEFTGEFLAMLESCADLGDFTALGRLVDDWKATAALHAEGLAPRLKKKLPATGQKVPRP